MKNPQRAVDAAFSWGVVTVAAAAGTLAVNTGSKWYRELDKPSWQPPPKVFPIAWTGLYAATAIASTRVLNRRHARGEGVDRVRVSLGLNMALNAGWTVLFFRGHMLKISTLEAAALALSTGALAHQFWKADRVSGAMVLPYVAWTSFATVLTAAIARANS